MSDKNNIKRKNRKNLRFITIALASITLIIWMMLLLYKYISGDLSISDILDDIIANMLGILPPIIIFNFAYEYFTKDYVADEMSLQMLETMTGNPEMMGTFKDEVRINFVKSTIKSMVGDEKVEMVYGVLNPYIGNRSFNMRVGFKYHVDFRKLHDARMMACSIFSKDDYYLVDESLKYTKVLSELAEPIRRLSIGFFVDSATLEKELLDKNYIFRESLVLLDADLQKLINFSDEEKTDFVKSCLKLKLLINGRDVRIGRVTIGTYGISIDYELDTPITDIRFDIDVHFKMPQYKGKSEFLVYITEPTLAPEITFTYESIYTKVKAYQFLNDDSKLIKDAGVVDGKYIINPSGWIYPVKGIVFIIEDLNDCKG